MSTLEQELELNVTSFLGQDYFADCGYIRGLLLEYSQRLSFFLCERMRPPIVK